MKIFVVTQVLRHAQKHRYQNSPRLARIILKVRRLTIKCGFDYSGVSDSKCTHSPGVICTHPERYLPSPKHLCNDSQPCLFFLRYLAVTNAQLAISSCAYLFWSIYEIPP